MAYRLGDYVIYGELWSTSRYSTRGGIILRTDAPDPEWTIHLELTGRPEPDLQGKHIRFRPGNHAGQDAIFERDEQRGFQDRQIGPTGAMTAQGWVRTLPCSVAEFMRRVDLGEPPPTEWKRRLYLEWYSQNGRVVIEMADAEVEECIRQPENEDDEGEWRPLPNLAIHPELQEAQPTDGPDITLIHLDENGPHIQKLPSPDALCRDNDDELSSAQLQRQLDAEAAAIERALQGQEPSEDDDVIREIELMDFCMEHGEGRPLHSFLDDIRYFPQPDTLDDMAVESWLKAVLARLAMIGVALDVCEHYTPRDCYALLVNEILKDESAYQELVGTGWVQHFMTHEYCSQCDAQFEKDFPSTEEPHAS